MYVAIKSMKNMPNKCVECGLKSGGYCYHKNPPYNLSESDMLKEKPSDCPLVEIVTCDDCKYCKKDIVKGKKFLWCDREDFATSEDCYCDDGERRE